MDTCPECAAQLSVNESTRPGEILVCADCQAELEVINTDPVLLALAPEIEEDWGE